jgi:outer membrane protein TolC
MSASERVSEATRMMHAIAFLPLFFAWSANAQAPERVTLQEAVNRALAKNPSAVVAGEEIRRAEALVLEARATWFPTLTGQGTYTRLDDDRVFGGSPGNPPRVIVSKDSLSANLTLTVPLVMPQAWARWSHAKDNVLVLRVSAADVRRQLALAVGHAYLAVVAQRRVVEVNERARVTAKAHAEFMRTRVEGGVGNRLDLVRAEQQLATTEAQVQQAYSGLARAEEALGVFLTVDAPVDSAEEPALAAPPSLADALGEARAKRADVALGKERVTAADHAVRDNWTDYSPYLVAIGQPFYQNPPSLTQPLTGWQAQLVLTLPLYDGGLRYGQAKEREANAAEARAQLDATLRQAQSDVRTAFEALRRADDALLASRAAAKLAGQALDLAMLAYRAGATTNIEVIDAERAARDAETQVAIAEDAARQARLDLLSASGRFP